jgi:hypothetical protein
MCVRWLRLYTGSTAVCICRRAPVDAYNCTTSRAFEQQLASIFVVSAKVIEVEALRIVLFSPTITPPPRSPPSQQMTMATTPMAMSSSLIKHKIQQIEEIHTSLYSARYRRDERSLQFYWVPCTSGITFTLQNIMDMDMHTNKSLRALVDSLRPRWRLRTPRTWPTTPCSCSLQYKRFPQQL